MTDPKNIERAEGTKGIWSVKRTEVSAAAAAIFNQKHGIFFGNRKIKPGLYWNLNNEKEGCVMSNTPAEINDHEEFFRKAEGRVLINGLGLGMAAEVVASKNEVEKVIVVERSSDVVDLIKPHLHSEKIEIVIDDAFSYEPSGCFDVVWHDIWSTISPLNISGMEMLEKKYKNISKWQGFWCEKECRIMKEVTSEIDAVIAGKKPLRVGLVKFMLQGK